MSHRTSIVFLGTSAFAIPALRALAADAAFDVQLVITQPDRPVGRRHVMTAPPVKQEAEKLGIPVRQPERLTDLSEHPDFLVVVSYGQILPQSVLDAARMMPVNVHASLLPELRGASPLQHAILQGLKESGVTVQKMVQELDAGPVLAQEKTPLSPRETMSTLHDRLAALGATVLLRTLKKPLHPIEQDHARKTLCGKLTKRDGIADPAVMTAEHVDRMVRALNPWPGVEWKQCKILETTLEENVHGFALPCAENTVLYVTKIQPAGGRPMTGVSFLRGHPEFLA